MMRQHWPRRLMVTRPRIGWPLILRLVRRSLSGVFAGCPMASGRFGSRVTGCTFQTALRRCQFLLKVQKRRLYQRWQQPWAVLWSLRVASSRRAHRLPLSAKCPCRRPAKWPNQSNLLSTDHVGPPLYQGSRIGALFGSVCRLSRLSRMRRPCEHCQTPGRFA